MLSLSLSLSLTTRPLLSGLCTTTASSSLSTWITAASLGLLHAVMEVSSSFHQPRPTMLA